MKTIKIIDLLNKIANGEKVPKKIKYEDAIYEYDDNSKFYYLDGFSLYREFVLNGNSLDKKVEIIEEKKLPKKYTTTSIHDIDNLDDKVALIHVDLICINDKVNKIIDYLESKEKGE